MEKKLLAMTMVVVVALGGLLLSEMQEEKVHLPQPKVTKVSGPKAWALACSAVLIERNHDFHDSLSNDDVSEMTIKKEKDLLSEWWGVENRKDLTESLDWIRDCGHRSDFESMGRRVTSMTDAQYADLEAAEGPSRNLARIVFLRQHYTALAEKSLIGWDYSRYICLCRWGYLCGYMGEQEAWDRIMPVARLLQNTFDSWEDLGSNYLIGREFWSPAQQDENGYLYEDAIQRLLDMPDSPWNTLAWNMDISEQAGEQSELTMGGGQS